MQKTIFVVDDNDTNLSMAKETLKDIYRVMTLPSAAKMFALMDKVTPDIILLDIEMPEMDGFEALNLLKSNELQANIPVIFLTSTADPSAEIRGFELGVIDFITKPFSAPVLLNRIKARLEIEDMINERTFKLQQKVEKLKNMQNVLLDIIENRSQGICGHIDRTTAYLKIIIEAMLAKGVYKNELEGIDLDLFISSSCLHDLGKVSIPDDILNKPGKLTDQEFELIKNHTREGERIIEQIVSKTEQNKEFIKNAKLFAGYHHELWDGNGYPQGLEKTNIPLQGRIMAIVDVYDALTTERPYKQPFTPEEAIRIIMDSAGKQFDPLITEVFYEVREQIEAYK
jgi:putative two-component system response regulator